MSDNSKFFDRPQPAAVLKHELLRRYVQVFASKTGSQSAGKVSYVDGYAGAGEYEDGTPGSPAHALAAADSISAFRKLRTTFVEKDRAIYEKLVQFADEREAEQPGLDIRVMHGAVEEHLDNILTAAGEDPMFMFLDPFGVGIDFDVLTAKILGRSRFNNPKTEVLLNFSVQAVDRIGGMINSNARHRDATLQRLNRTLGGDYWQELWLANIGAARTQAIATEYRARVSAASGGWGGWTLPVADSLTGRPAYLLMQFTQHRDGRWEFYQSMTFATAAWRQACHQASPSAQKRAEEAGQFCLDGMDKPLPFEADTMAWSAEIEQNARRLVADGQVFVLQDRLADLCGRALGLAREMHIRTALKPLWRDRLLANEPKGKLQRYVFAPAKRV